MKTLAILFLAVAMTASAWAGTPSRPDRATIYRDGYAVLEETLGRMEPQGAIRLPAQTDLTSVRVLKEGKYLGDIQIEEIIEEEKTTEKTVVGQVVVEKPVTVKKRVGYLMRPGISKPVGNGKLLLRYGTSTRSASRSP
jgi:hypothetical protein